MRTEKIEFSNDSHSMSIRLNGQVSYIEVEDGKLVTDGFVGENTYDSLVDLIRGLQGFGITMDNIYF